MHPSIPIFKFVMGFRALLSKTPCCLSPDLACITLTSVLWFGGNIGTLSIMGRPDFETVVNLGMHWDSKVENAHSFSFLLFFTHRFRWGIRSSSLSMSDAFFDKTYRPQDHYPIPHPLTSFVHSSSSVVIVESYPTTFMLSPSVAKHGSVIFCVCIQTYVLTLFQ